MTEDQAFLGTAVYMDIAFNSDFEGMSMEKVKRKGSVCFRLISCGAFTGKICAILRSIAASSIHSNNLRE
jgi:hypothetical protein